MSRYDCRTVCCGYHSVTFSKHNLIPHSLCLPVGGAKPNAACSIKNRNCKSFEVPSTHTAQACWMQLYIIRAQLLRAVSAAFWSRKQNYSITVCSWPEVISDEYPVCLCRSTSIFNKAINLSFIPGLRRCRDIRLSIDRNGIWTLLAQLLQNGSN